MSKLATGSRELWLENLNYQHQLPYLWSRICKLIGASRKWLICRLQPASFWVNNGFLMKRTKIFHRVPKKGKKIPVCFGELWLRRLCSLRLWEEVQINDAFFILTQRPTSCIYYIPGSVTNLILFCWLFTLKDWSKKSRFQQTQKQGFCQLFLTVSWDLHA